MIPSVVEKAERFILNHLDSASTMLVAMGIIGTITSSIAQRIGIRANPNIPQDKKEFLINQEKKDCMLNVGLTWLTGTGSKKLVHTLTNKGYLLNESVRSAADKIALYNGMSHKELAKIGFYKVKGDLPAISICQPQYKSLKRNFLRCQEGLSVIAAVGAAILTTNLIVPILRNKLATPPKPKQKISTLTEYVSQKPAQKFMATYQPTYSNSNLRI